MRAYHGVLPPGHPDIRRILDNMVENPPVRIGCDIETPSVKDQTILGMGISTEDGLHSYYFDFTDKDFPWWAVGKGPTRKVWYNAPFDLSREALGRYQNTDLDNIDDAIILSRMEPTWGNTLEEASWNVEVQAQNMGKVLKKYKVRTVDKLPWPVVAEKCCTDAVATIQVFNKLRDRFSEKYYNHECRFQSMLLHMSRRGIRLDKQRVADIDAEIETTLDRLKDIAKDLDFNPLSPKDVLRALNAKNIYVPVNPRTREPDTTRATLEKINHPIAGLVIAIRKYNRLHSTNTHKWLGKDRIYSHFRMDGITGRTNSVDQNVQNIPTGHRPTDIKPKAGSIRSVLIPDRKVLSFTEIFEIISNYYDTSDENKAKLMAMWMNTPSPVRVGTKFDLSQIELRILAYLSGDKEMQRIFASPDGDLHGETFIATRLPSRTLAKNFNFGMVYGGSPEIISLFTGIKDVESIVAIMNNWRQKFPQAWGWIEQQRREGLRTYGAETMYGRRFDLTTSHSSNQSDKHIMNCAINWPIQGTAAEIFKRIGGALSSYGITDDLLISQIHDEFWIDGPQFIPQDIEHVIPELWTPIEQELVERFG